LSFVISYDEQDKGGNQHDLKPNIKVKNIPSQKGSANAEYHDQPNGKEAFLFT